MTTSVPLREGLFRETPDGPTLLGTRCTGCGHVSFPPTARCPACRDEDLETVELGDRAELLCSTTVHMGSQHFAPGYTVGYVMLPGGVRVFSQLAAAGHAPMTPGTPLRLEIVPMWQDGETDVLAYRFAPV